MKKILFLLFISLVVSGCVSTQDSSMLIRKGYRDIKVGKPQKAEKKAEKILKKRENDPAGLVLLARARMAQDNQPGALDALETLDHITPSDWACPDRIALHEGYLLKSALDNDLATLYRAEKVEKSIYEDMRSRHLMTQVRYYEDQGDPVKAATAFGQYEEIKDHLLPDENLHGFVLYYSSLRSDDARRLWKQLTPKQQQSLLKRYEKIEF